MILSEKSIILGTAGHIDHGKTAFIRALTGIECDRLKEEKERGITIELGYAHMRLPSGIKVGIVDVPGHERFVSKMVAGAAGIDVVALLIAADEGIKPQTQEHLHICDILGIRKGLVVLNKKDLVDEELLFLQSEEIEKLLKGTFLEGAPIIAVSSISTEGLDEFIRALDRMAADVVAKPVQKPFRLPVDAVVTITGFGTVVRGTALSGRIAAGEEVAILPTDKRSRIRGLQNHGQMIDEGRAGERLAINLADVKKDDIDRGMVVAQQDCFCPSDKFLVELTYLPYNKKPLKSKTHCQFHALAARANAEVNLLRGEKLLPGDKTCAVVKTAQPLVVAHGDSFVIRGYGFFTTIGGGRILNPALPYYREKDLTEEYVRTLSDGCLTDKIPLFVKESGEKGMTLLSLCGILNESEIEIRKQISQLKREAVIYEDDGCRIFHNDHVMKLQKDISRMIHDYHLINPLRIGIGKEELFNRTTAELGLFHLVLHWMIQENRIEIVEDLVKAKQFNVGDACSGMIMHHIEKLFLEYGLQPELPAETAKKVNLEKRKLTEALDSLARSGRMIKIREDYYLHPEHFEHFRSSLKVFFEDSAILTPQDMRERFGLSRKHLIPLLEYLDAIKVTVRTAEGRRLRK